MILGTYPLIAWGTADDLSTYTNINTCSVTGGQTDPFGGTSAYLLNDASGAEVRYVRTAATALTGTQVPVDVFVKAGTSTFSLFQLYDTTAAATRLTMLFVPNGGNPYLTAGVGTALSLVSVGGGWYLARSLSTTIVSGNSHRLELYPTDNNIASTGTVTYYVRNHVLLDVPSAYRRYARVRGGYETAVTPAGARDSWSYGDEWVRSARQSWVPATARDTPVSVSGFVGANELTGVNCGVEAMLRTGWDLQTMRWVPDRSACTVYQDVYLTAPGQDWQPQAEGNGDSAFDLELVSASAPGVVP